MKTSRWSNRKIAAAQEMAITPASQGVHKGEAESTPPGERLRLGARDRAASIG
jgi:hypothetical protein